MENPFCDEWQHRHLLAKKEPTYPRLPFQTPLSKNKILKKNSFGYAISYTHTSLWPMCVLPRQRQTPSEWRDPSHFRYQPKKYSHWRRVHFHDFSDFFPPISFATSSKRVVIDARDIPVVMQENRNNCNRTQFPERQLVDACQFWKTAEIWRGQINWRETVTINRKRYLRDLVLIAVVNKRTQLNSRSTHWWR